MSGWGGDVVARVDDKKLSHLCSEYCKRYIAYGPESAAIWLESKTKGYPDQQISEALEAERKKWGL